MLLDSREIRQMRELIIRMSEEASVGIQAKHLAAHWAEIAVLAKVLSIALESAAAHVVAEE